LNPYAAPRARLEHDALAGALWRAGKLVRMGRESELPDRCVVCSAPASGYRVKRRLYWAPAAWTRTAPFVPVAVFLAGTFLRNPMLMMLVWPTAIVLYVTHLFVRKSFRLAVGLCPRHRAIRHALLALSVGCIVVMALALFTSGRLGRPVRAAGGAAFHRGAAARAARMASRLRLGRGDRQSLSRGAAGAPRLRWRPSSSPTSSSPAS
jgi:hypothetical protein